LGGGIGREGKRQNSRKDAEVVNSPRKSESGHGGSLWETAGYKKYRHSSKHF